MQESYETIFYCIACGLDCEKLIQEENDIVLCTSEKIYVWPTTNCFFVMAIHDIIKNGGIYLLAAGVVVIDFSVHNLKYFIGKEWLIKLKKMERKGLKIIMLIERPMLALANYWKKDATSFILCIVQNFDRKKIIHEFRKILTGALSYHPRKPVITDNEMITLRLAIKGQSVKKISQLLNCSVSNVYRYKNSIRKKLGVRQRYIKNFI